MIAQPLLFEVPAVECVLCHKPGAERMLDLTDGGRGGVHHTCLALEAMRLEDAGNKFLADLGHPSRIDLATKYIRIARGGKLPVGKVRCISLWQPWASLMLAGKFIETRHWDTKVRGTVFIHAGGQDRTRKGIAACKSLPPAHLEAIERALGLPIDRWLAELPHSALIAHGQLIRTLSSREALATYPSQRHFGDFGPGRFGHFYGGLCPIEPIPCKGAQGFFFAPAPSSP